MNDWRDLALCAEVDPELFHPKKGQPAKPAKAICARCLVRAECLEFALEDPYLMGVWGGKSARERRRLLGLPDEDGEEEMAA